MDSSIPDNRVDEWAPGLGNFGYFARMEMNPLNPAPITAVCFDPFEELLWCGNYNGRVTSFYSNTFDRYTAFCAVGGDIRALEATENALIVLSANNLKANTRHGLHSFQFSSPSMVNMCALHRLPGTPSLIMGGEQNKLIQFDIEKQRETRLSTLKQKDATLIRSNGNNVFTADTEGKITVRLMSSLEALNIIPAHGGPITDFDVYGNKLITCGCSLRLNALHGDPYVKIYDLRTCRALPPLPLSFAPVFTRFIPTFCDSRIVIVSQMGQTQMTDLNERGVGVPMIIESDGYNLSAFHHSSTKHLMAFGDEIGIFIINVKEFYFYIF
uniref:WD_REPEATS_REGION domain-containing protein n=1 Tax=Heterorhabditis bacteriophora TaxID=37862 RepID=A0A1I7XRW9_HETBA